MDDTKKSVEGRQQGTDIAPRTSYDDDVPVSFRRQKRRRRSWITHWIRASLVVALISAGLIGVIALGQGIEFVEYWYLVGAAFGGLALLLLWESVASYFSSGD